MHTSTTRHTGPLGSTIHVLHADPDTVAALAAIDWNQHFSRVCLDPVRGVITLAVPSWLMDSRHEGYVPELEERFEGMYGYDPERAWALLAEAGYPDAFPEPVIPIVSSVLSGNPEFGTMAELLQVYFEAVGLQTEIREMDWATLGALGRAREAYLISPARNAPIRPTEAALVNFHTVRGTRYGGYESDTSEGLADKLEQTIDPAERDAIAKEAFTPCCRSISWATGFVTGSTPN